MAAINFLVTNILYNILFCVQQKKETHTELEQLEGKNMMTEFSYRAELSLYRNVH